MYTSVRSVLNKCGAAQKYFGGWIADGDIAISTIEDWFVDLDESLLPSTSNKLDLYSVLTHEIGHSLGLCHAMDTDDSNGANDSRIMYYGVSNGQIKRELDSESTDGVGWLIDKTDWSLGTLGECFLSGFVDITTVPQNSSCYAPTSLIEVEHSCDVKVNNQFISSIGLEISLDVLEPHKVSLLNAYGQIIYSSTESGVFTISTNSLAKGMYFLKVSCDIAPQVFKIILQ